MKLKNFDYNLPRDLIAQKPVKPRDQSRLLLLDKKTGEIKHKYFYNIINYLKKGDILVLNNSKVFPARLIGRKKLTGGKIEVFLLRKNPPRPLYQGGSVWNCLLGGRGRKEGLEIKFNPESSGLECKVIKNNNNGIWEIKFNKSGKELMKIVEKIGLTPLPPYIKRAGKNQIDKKDYQTVYADDKKVGSVAAPTAGFHFTLDLIRKLKAKGVQFEYITLHIGLGTFVPVKVDNITKHKMQAEWVEVKKDVIEEIVKAKEEGRRIVAVGTTSVRALETIFQDKRGSPPLKGVEPLNGFRGWTDIFIYPPYKFRVVDAIITNFHLPKSTLLMLVSAFASKKNIDKVYKQAMKKKYRFFSYGDAMFIH